MAQQTTVAIPAGVWTQITDADATAVAFQNASGYAILIKGTAGATAPTNKAGAYIYNPGQGERATIADLFPGIAGANRLWALAEGFNGAVVVSHA